MVLATDSDTGYDPSEVTEVLRRNRRKVRKKSKKKKRKSPRKRNVKHRGQGGNVFAKSVRRKNKWRESMRKRKVIIRVTSFCYLCRSFFNNESIRWRFVFNKS